jgi:hypothetical protein
LRTPFTYYMSKGGGPGLQSVSIDVAYRPEPVLSPAESGGGALDDSLLIGEQRANNYFPPLVHCNIRLQRGRTVETKAHNSTEQSPVLNHKSRFRCAADSAAGTIGHRVGCWKLLHSESKEGDSYYYTAEVQQEGLIAFLLCRRRPCIKGAGLALRFVGFSAEMRCIISHYLHDTLWRLEC